MRLNVLLPELLADSLGLESSQIFLGNRDDIPELLGQSDLFAYSTTSAEGAPFALIEALGAGLPIVASRAAACPEILADGFSGLLLPMADIPAWSAALHYLWANSERRKQLSLRALERSAFFDISNTSKIFYSRLWPNA